MSKFRSQLTDGNKDKELDNLFLPGLEKGSKGEEVINLNTYLRNYFRGIVDVKNYAKSSKDLFDDETVKELKVFQKQHKLKETGKLDKNTLLTINNIKCITLPTHGYYPNNTVSRFFDIVTNPDHKQYNARHYFFNKTDLTYGFENFTDLFADHNVQMDKGSSEEIQRDLMDRISKHITETTKFTLNEDKSGKPDITIDFTIEFNIGNSKFRFEKGDKTVGTTIPPLRNPATGIRETNDSQIYMNDRKSWTNNKSISHYGYKNIVVGLLHEIGHSIGLAHTDRNTSVMYYSYNENMERLDQDDINGYNTIYNIIKTKLKD
jgi:hypothetical protein